MRNRQKSSFIKSALIYQRGLTLIELMVGLAVAAILLGIAIPSFTEARLTVRASTAIEQFQQDLLYGRQLSVAYQNSITICPVNSSNQCDGQWRKGYHIFIDANNNDAMDNNEERLVSRGEFHDDDFVTAATMYRFNTEGFLDNDDPIIYCSGEKDGDHNKQLDLTETGLISRANNSGNCQ